MEAGYLVVTCRSCGAGRADVALDPSYYARYYAEVAKYGAPDAASSGNLKPVTTAADAHGAYLVSELVGDLSCGVLDVGCGTGGMLAALAERGVERLLGVDPSPASVDIASSRPGVAAVVGDSDSLPEEAFSCVSLLGVVEHLAEPRAALAACAARLVRGGALFVVLPDAERYLDPYCAPFGDFNTEHVNHLSSETLAQLAAGAGLTVARVQHFVGAVAPGAPAAHLAAVLVPTSRPTPRPGPDERLVEELRAYAARSMSDLELVDAALEEALAGEPRFALFGAGEAAFLLLGLPALASRDLAGIADSNPARHALTVRGRRVGPPGALPKDVPVLAASFLRSASIVAAAERLGLSDRLVVLDQWRAGRPMSGLGGRRRG